MKHPHAELMLQYAQDAMETDFPCDRWQYKSGGNWQPCINNPLWHKTHQYRRKPKTININGIEVPEPERKALEDETKYFVPNLDGGFRSVEYRWNNDSTDYRLLSLGLVHKTKEAAIAHTDALLSFTKP